MKTLKQTIALLLALTLLISCCACSRPEDRNTADPLPGQTGSPQENNPAIQNDPDADVPAITATPAPTLAPSTNMVPGHIVTEIPFPDAMNAFTSWGTGWDTYGDTIWLAGSAEDDHLILASYDTVQNQWNVYDMETADAQLPIIDTLSVSETAVWALLTETPTEDQLRSGYRPSNLGYYVYCMDLSTGASTCSRVSASGESDGESSTMSFTSLVALDAQSALLASYGNTYVIDTSGNATHTLGLQIGNNSSFRIGEEHYLFSAGSYYPLDETNLTLGEACPYLTAFSYSSNRGNYLAQRGGAVYQFDPASNSSVELFQWMDAVLSYSMMGSFYGLENSQGDFLYLADGALMRVTAGMVPEKYELSLVCFGDGAVDLTGRDHATAYSCTPELLDAIIRFNNTDPVYKVALKPMIYTNDGERDRFLIELATSTDFDLIDTSLLPDNALDDSLLVDLMPYIDADNEISREDFIQPLLKAMMNDGRLYEYTDKFALLTTCVSKDLYPGKENWTSEAIENLLRQNSKMLQNDGWSREERLCMFAWAATAEFIDWENMTCSFNSEAFQNWLQLLKKLPDNSQYDLSPKQMTFSCNYPSRAGVMMRQDIGSDYVVAGYPDTEGNGSYFIKLGASFDESGPAVADSTRVGMMASGAHKDGAWRFIKTLMLGNANSGISEGIPVFANRFEQALSASIDTRKDLRTGLDYFSEADAQTIRDLVYNTTKLVRTDESLINVIRSEANAYLSGQKSAEAAANQIQSRITIYLAENG